MQLKLSISKIKSIKLQLHLLFNFTEGSKKDQLNSIDLEYLAYFILYGPKVGKEKILEDEVSVSKEVWHNKLYKFRTLGLLKGKGEATILDPRIKLNLESFDYKLTLNVQ